MKRRLVLLLAAAGLLIAATHAPAASYYASPPTVILVDHGQTTIQGSARMSGYPSPIGTESATITVVAQHYENGGWVDRGTTETRTKAWNSRTPGGSGARAVSAISTAICQVGDWRTKATGYDNAPREFYSTVITYTLGDSGVPCSGHLAD